MGYPYIYGVFIWYLCGNKWYLGFVGCMCIYIWDLDGFIWENTKHHSDGLYGQNKTLYMGFGLMDFDGDGHRDLVWDTTNKHEIRIGYVYI